MVAQKEPTTTKNKQLIYMDLPKQILKESDRLLSYNREEKTFRGMSDFDLFPWVTSVRIGLLLHSFMVTL